MKSQTIRYPNQNLVIDPPEVTPQDVAPAPTLDDLCDVVGNRAWFNVLLINGVTVRASSSFPVLGIDVDSYITSGSLYTGQSDIEISSQGGIRFRMAAGTVLWAFNIAGTYKGAFKPLASNQYDIGENASCVRNIYWGGVLQPGGSGRETGVVQNRTKSGVPTDADMPVWGASDGMMVVDTQNNKIWVRCTGVWKGVVVA